MPAPLPPLTHRQRTVDPHRSQRAEACSFLVGRAAVAPKEGAAQLLARFGPSRWDAAAGEGGGAGGGAGGGGGGAEGRGVGSEAGLCLSEQCDSLGALSPENDPRSSEISRDDSGQRQCVNRSAGLPLREELSLLHLQCLLYAGTAHPRPTLQQR